MKGHGDWLMFNRKPPNINMQPVLGPSVSDSAPGAPSQHMTGVSSHVRSLGHQQAGWPRPPVARIGPPAALFGASHMESEGRTSGKEIVFGIYRIYVCFLFDPGAQLQHDMT